MSASSSIRAYDRASTCQQCHRRGQISVEFIIIFMLVLILFVFFALLFFGRYVSASADAATFAAVDRCNALSAPINYLFLSPNATTLQLSLPATLGNGNAYNVTWGQHSLILLHAGQETSCFLVSDRINGTLAPAGTYLLTIEGGVVRVT